MSAVEYFLSDLISKHSSGKATEHSYRPALESLFRSIDENITAVNEPKRVKCGAPDFVFLRRDVPIGHLEAKDVDVDIRKLKGHNKEQHGRYLGALQNLIYTNGLDWDFYRHGQLVESVTIGQLDKAITPQVGHFTKLESLLADFFVQTPITIERPKDLAKRMAGKAKLIKEVFFRALSLDLESKADTELAAQYEVFKNNLIHDITPEGFADIYAETICYGMFAARLHDDVMDTFSRHEALDKLPKTNPFLKSLFGYVAGSGFDERIAWIIDDLADIFRATDVRAIIKAFGTLTGREDPFLHFYETFLAAYDPKRRKARGVWYTPEPVVNFIVRAVDEVLRTEFGLQDGLADTSKIKIQWDTGQRKTTKAGRFSKDGKNVTVEKEVHRVQVLDPATGTGTFLAEVIKQIAPKVKDVAPGMWSSYVENDLIPRIHGFEILMASYAMCHMKLDMVLTELGYKPSNNPPRQSVYLTNSLEEGDPVDLTLPFARWLSNEVKLANTIKRDMPIMCVIGNPPYLGEGGVSEGWLGELMDDYKKEPGGECKLNERQSKWLNDLYVKFIRISSHLIESNGEGVLGFITNHGYLDSPTFRGMRWHLLKTFDKIWVLDLHGNSNGKEVDPATGKADKNIFDIKGVGVSIIIAVKSEKGSDGLAKVMQGDLWGTRERKYKALQQYGLNDGLFKKLELMPPRFPFVQRDWGALETYQKGFSINQFMPLNSSGIVTSRDSLTIDYDRAELWSRVQDFSMLDSEVARKKYRLRRDASHWSVRSAQEDVRANLDVARLTPIAYRPFDVRWTFYTGNSGGFMARPLSSVMRHILAGENVALVVARQCTSDWRHVFVSKFIGEFNLTGTAGRFGSGKYFPLYLYAEQDDHNTKERNVNFDPTLYTRLQKLAEHPDHGTPNEVEVFDYIYGVLHCPAYRRTYAEFLKSDVPLVPWPITPNEFWDVSRKGNVLRKLHLMEPAAVGATPFPFEGEGNNLVESVVKSSYLDGKIWINQSQCFTNVPKVAWDFHIGGYQPARTWLASRVGRVLSFDDVRHYQRIIKILSETEKMMGTINMTFK